MIVISLQCVQYIDSAVLVELVPRLTDLIKSGIGIGTKVSLCHLDFFLPCPVAHLFNRIFKQS